MNIFSIIKKTRIEVIKKIITSIFVRGLLLIIPIYYSNAINNLTNLEYDKAYKLVFIILLLSLLYYFWSYLNQKSWYRFYNKLYIEYTEDVINSNIKNITLGEYTNIINNDIDIIGTFIGNGVTRIIQVLEFLFIYIYFFKVDLYIFLVTIIISILMIGVILFIGKKIEIENKNRKDNLDYKTVNIHNIYDIIKNNKKIKDNSFIDSTINYLNSNAKYNLLVNLMIYIVLSFIEFCRYGILLYSIYLVSINNMEIGTILLIYSYYAKIITNFEVLGTIDAEWKSVKVSISRLNKIREGKMII